MIFFNLLSIEKFIGIGYENIHEYYYRADTEPHKTEMVETFKLTFPCNFAFETYPFDKQICDLSFIDKLYETDHVVLNTPTTLFYKNQHSTFKNNSLLMITLPKTSFTIGLKINQASSIIGGKVSSAGIKLILQRKFIGLLLGSFYVPTGIFAILSMASFVIKPDIVSFNPFICYLI